MAKLSLNDLRKLREEKKPNLKSAALTAKKFKSLSVWEHAE